MKIKKYNSSMDLDRIMEIWLEANLKAHSFIDNSFWLDNQPLVRNLIKESLVYVAFLEEEIIGFTGLSDSFIAGFFIADNYRGLGYGAKLLDFLKLRYDLLSLDVYAKNYPAIDFYKKNGFKIIDESYDDNNEKEYRMEYRKTS